MDSATATLNIHFNQLPGQYKPPTIVLKRGKDSSMALWAWHESVRKANLGNLRVSATLSGSAGPDQLEIIIAEGSDQEIETIIKCAAVPPPSSPPSLGSVQGTVETKGVSVAPEATVELKVGDAVKGTAETNDKGEYKIDFAAADYLAVADLLSGPSRDKPLTLTVNVSVTAG